MALTKNIEWKGFEVENSYAVIEEFRILKRNQEKYNIYLTVNFYSDSTKENFLFKKDIPICISYNGGCIQVSNMYAEIKINEYFENWEDC